MRTFIIFIIFFTSVVRAEVTQNPEDCFQRDIWPCLMSADQAVELKKSDKKFFLSQDAVVKWHQNNDEIKFDVLQGLVRVESKTERNITVNGFLVISKMALISRSGLKLEIYETNQFNLNELELKDDQFQLAKKDFLPKSDLVKFARRFYVSSNDMAQFLKDIEKPWKDKFDDIVAEQTKVIQRSVAAIEEAERKKQEDEKRARIEREKVRDLFFYRTFYR